MAININNINRKANGKLGFGPAKGNAPATGMPVTPAPTKKYIAPDVVSRLRAPVNTGYGMNSGADNPSSIPAGNQLLSPLAEVLKQDTDDGEHVLDKIISGGAKTDDLVTGQLRAIGDKNVPDHPAMKSPNKTGSGTYDFDSLPTKVGSSAAPPVRKP
jgi:hypothetical protein